ncbi:hypothetical protein K470DRAFT_270941 [Piedraia hortae CBS 480.64]|uniref:Uncharacterized protein n=1 Tax=Piedraia hortae CBS 480.64 TaxID=1314780 RepID=A0A6A7BZR6_9PEZI|nr:hypothetical protein K470DRAFT_270941 [Piedraia hortae CBS 480.64]
MVYIGIPVGDNKQQEAVQHTKWWITVNPANHLRQYNSRLSLAEKLALFLQKNGIDDGDCAFAYLVTPPSILGYDPALASFWYLYDSETVLKHIILETHDGNPAYLLSAAEKTDLVSEKQMFLDRSSASSSQPLSILAADPLTCAGNFDNTICADMVVAQLWSDPNLEVSMHLLVSNFVLLVQNALRWHGRGLALEPTQSAAEPDYSFDEQNLEETFQRFLSYAVKGCIQPLYLIYKPARDDAEICIRSPSLDDNAKQMDGNTLKIAITNPAFYSRFVKYPLAEEAFEKEAGRTC